MVRAIKDLCGKDAKRWQMWQRIENREKVTASDLQDAGYITRTTAALFLEELCREGYIEAAPGRHYVNGKSAIIYQKRGVS